MGCNSQVLCLILTAGMCTSRLRRAWNLLLQGLRFEGAAAGSQTNWNHNKEQSQQEGALLANATVMHVLLQGEPEEHFSQYSEASYASALSCSGNQSSLHSTLNDELRSTIKNMVAEERECATPIAMLCNPEDVPNCSTQR